MNDQRLDSQLLLADQFFALATGENEAAIRSSLSRLYYASFHVATALTGGTSHGDIAKRLTETHGEIGQRFKSYHKLRSQLDYDHDFFRREGIKDPGFWYRERLREGISLYLQLRGIVDAAKG